MKKIYIDGLGLVESHFSGVGQYILGVLRGMDSVIDERKKNSKKVREVMVMLPNDAVDKFNSFGFKHVQYKTFPMSTGKMLAMWHHNKLPPMDLWYGRGIYIFPRFVSMRLAFSKSILVIYDLSFELHKEFVEDNNARFLSGAVGRSVKKSDRIITISKNSRQEVIDFYHVPPAKVLVATPAADKKHFYRRTAPEIRSAKQKYGVTGDYILALSNLEPRKNLESLIDAYSQLPAYMKQNLSLLIVGSDGWKADRLFQKIDRQTKSKGRIIRPTNYVSDKDKAAIISGAKLFVYPSHYEGFGMPPLEALACGVPVITSNNSSLPEVVGETSVMVDSHDLKGLTRSIESAIRHIDSVSRQAQSLGPKQAAKFSWQQSANVFFEAVDALD